MYKIAAILTSTAIALGGIAAAQIPVASAQSLAQPVCVSCTQEQEETLRTYAQQVAQLVNQQRSQAGLPELKVEENLCAAAQQRAQEIDRVFSHTRPDGSSSFSILKEMKIDYLACGENIARGSQTPEAVMDGWMHSAGHRRNILNERFTSLGVGCYADAAGTLHWVQIFTTDRDSYFGR